jgi:hypothetical protein
MNLTDHRESGAQSLDIFVLDLSDPDYNQDPPQRVNVGLTFSSIIFKTNGLFLRQLY